jgi:ATP-dependent Clp protease ATP-binding subunit ClpC
MVAGTKYRGQFEERMKWVIQLVEYANKINKKLILFIDEIHTLVNAGAAEGSISGGAILKPKLSSDEIHCIGATTPEDYRKHLTKDEALARRFSKLYLDEPQIEEVHNIVNNIKDEYEKFHNVTVDNDALDEIVNLSDRYIKDRFFPDKALDILDESCSKVVLNNGTTVSVDTIEKIVSDRTGIPITVVSGEEKEILRHLEGDIKEIVVSQEGAIKKVCKSVRKSRIGLKDENKPIGVYLFLGPTGVGKTLLSKTLSEKLFGKNKIIRLDMSEYMDKTSVNKITGSPAGYVGYEEGSAFLEQVRQKPYSVILLDEIEKAHKDVLNVFLGIFDEGRLTDSCGRLCDFRNTIIIMTSNLATERLKKNKFLGFNKHNVSSDKEIEDYLIEKVEGYFSPEFIGRITDIVIFNELTKDDARNIFNIEFNKIKKRIKKVGYSIEITEEALSFMCDRGYSEKYGARPMGKIISNLIEDPITDLIIDTGAKKGSIVSISRATDKEELAFQLKNSKE